MNLFNEKIRYVKRRRNFLRLIVIEFLIFALLLSWQYYSNREELEKLTQEQEILIENMAQYHFTEKINFGNRKKLIEAYEDNQKTMKLENDQKHRAINSTLEVIQEISMDPNVYIANLYLEENRIEIKGSARDNKVIDKHFAELTLPHYGKFEPLEYNNYAQDQYQFILRNQLDENGGFGDE